MTARPTGERSALAAGLACYLMWGALPLLLRAAGEAGAGAWEIVAWRTVWSLPFALILVAATGRLQAVRAAFKDPGVLKLLLLSSLLIGVNWSVYVYAVDTHRTLQASLGYYINPLMNVAAGALLFREKMDRTGWVAVGLALVGVLVQAVAVGGLPWISITLAVSFCAYAVVRKQVAVDAQTGLMVECLVLMWPAAAYLLWLAPTGAMAFGASTKADLLLAAGGLATVLPLVAFTYSARNLPLTTIGFMQFLSPTIQFFVGVFAFGEALTPMRLVSFVFIWGGAAVFVIGAFAAARRRFATVVA